jgi:hypothetical protein
MNLGSRTNYVLYMVQHGGAHYPQIWGATDQGVAGDRLGMQLKVYMYKR